MWVLFSDGNVTKRFGYSNESAEELMPCCSFNGIVQTLAMSDEEMLKVMQFERRGVVAVTLPALADDQEWN
jgi:hypothetical protein